MAQFIVLGINLSSNTLSQAIYAAGGPKDWKSNKGNVELIRINRNGSAILKKYRINLRENVNDKTNPYIRWRYSENQS